MLVMLLMVVASNAEASAAAKAAFEELQYAKADAEASKAIRAGSLDASQFADMLEIRAVSAAMTKKSAAAKDLFNYLLSVAPSYQLPAQFGPRVRTPFLEAKTQSTSTRVQAINRSANTDTDCSVSVVDPLNYVDEVAVTLTAGVAKTVSSRKSTEFEADRPMLFKGSKSTDGCAVELKDRYGNVLAVAPEAGSKWTLGVVVPPPEDAMKDIRLKEPALREPNALDQRLAEPNVEAKPQASGSPALKVIGVVAGVAAAGAFVGAGIMGYRSQELDRTFLRVNRDSAGRISSVSQASVADLTKTSKEQATVANALFITGGVLAAGGILSFALSF
jgi:hypothetical protein